MRALAASALLFGICLMWGCASSTTVVLMPDENGHVGALSVTTKAGSQTIDRAFNSTVVDDRAAPPPRMREMGEEALTRNYGDALAAQPNPPLTYLVYFALGSSALTASSMNTISEAVGSILRRAPAEVALFGHADATGTERSNVRLSAERAKAVEQALHALDPDLGEVRLEYFGDKEPLVPSVPDVAEPMNRCVEILIW